MIIPLSIPDMVKIVFVNIIIPILLFVLMIAIWTIFFCIFEDYLFTILYLPRNQSFLTPNQIYENTNIPKWLSWIIVIFLRIINPIYSVCCFVLWLLYREK